MTDELKAACERLRRFYAAHEACNSTAMDAIYPMYGDTKSVWNDQETLAKAYLAEHPEQETHDAAKS